MAEAVSEAEEKITKYFPISPHCDHKYTVKNRNPINHVSTDIPRTESSLPDSLEKDSCIKLDIKTELEFPIESCDSPKPKYKKVSKTEHPLPSNKGNKGRGKGRGRKKATACSTAQSSVLKPKTEKKVAIEKKPATTSRVLTDYFPVRRSYRMTSTEMKKQQEKTLEDAILSERVDGLKVVEFAGKGRGVVSTRPFTRGEFVVEYYGDLIDLTSAKGRESKYSTDVNIGCYMYYFNFKNKNFCVDATAESGKLGRLLNHSRNGNCKTQVVGVRNRPHLILVAARDIVPGEELLYDYGDRNKETLEAHPWLAL